MILNEQQQQGQALLQELVTKSWESDEFKTSLMSDPKATIESVTGNKIDLPKDKKIVVVDQTNSDIVYINIPSKPSLDDIDLTDEQLELVAGGEVAVTAAVATVGGLAVLGAGYLVGRYVL